jgi:hypothetical protein
MQVSRIAGQPVRSTGKRRAAIVAVTSILLLGLSGCHYHHGYHGGYGYRQGGHGGPGYWGYGFREGHGYYGHGRHGHRRGHRHGRGYGHD